MGGEEIGVIRQIVWAQTYSFRPDNDIEHLKRLQSSLAALTKQDQTAVGTSFRTKTLEYNEPDDTKWVSSMIEAVDLGLTDPAAFDPALPTRIGLWPVGQTNEPHKAPDHESMLFSAENMKTTFLEYKSGRKIGCFESSEARREGENAIVSYSSIASTAFPSAKPVLGIILVALGLLIFAIAIGSSLSTGVAIGNARDAMAGFRSPEATKITNAISGQCKLDNSRDIKTLPVELCNGEEFKREAFISCLSKNTIEKFERGATAHPWEPHCVTAFEIVLNPTSLATYKAERNVANATGFEELVTSIRKVIVGFFSLLASSAASIVAHGTVSIFGLMLAAMFGLYLVLIGLGYTFMGLAWGITISGENRLSLSLMQMVIWTTLLLSTYSIASAFNIGLLSDFVVNEGTGTTLYPQLKGWAWAVMGIVLASPLAANLLKGRIPSQDELKNKPKPGAKRIPRLLQVNSSPSMANFSEIFSGEMTHNSNRLELSRVQNVIITVLLLVTYAGWLALMLDSMSYEALLSAIDKKISPFTDFPDPGKTFTALLFVSHGAYLATKFAEMQSEDPKSGSLTS